MSYSRVTIYKLDGNPHLVISNTSFKNFTAVKKLSLPDSDINFSTDKLFAACIRLQELNFTKSRRISALSVNLFNSTRQLKALRGLSAVELPPGLFANLKYLLVLEFDTEQSVLNGSVFSADNGKLRELYITADNVTNLPTQLLDSVAKFLTILHLQIHKVRNINHEFFNKMEKLKNVKVVGHQLSINCPWLSSILYDVEIVIESVLHVDGCAFHNIKRVKKIAVDSVGSVACRIPENPTPSMTDLSVTRSGLTNMTGR